MDVFIDRQRHDQSLVVVSVVAQQFKATGRAHNMRRGVVEVPFKDGLNVGIIHGGGVSLVKARRSI